MWCSAVHICVIWILVCCVGEVIIHVYLGLIVERLCQVVYCKYKLWFARMLLTQTMFVSKY